jgi:hypothetical protein
MSKPKWKKKCDRVYELHFNGLICLLFSAPGGFSLWSWSVWGPNGNCRAGVDHGFSLAKECVYRVIDEVVR